MCELKSILIFILFCSADLMAKDIIPYASFGMRIGWDFKCGPIISHELSSVLAEREDGAFINVILG